MPSIRQQKTRLASLALMPFLLMVCMGGCRSTMGLFLPIDNHPQIINEARMAVIQQDPSELDATLSDLEKRTAASSRMLYLLESGRLKALTDQTQASIDLFNEAGTLAESQDLKASLTVTESLQNALSMVTNDRALPYKGHLFERLFLYYFQSLNYLKTGDPAKAQIELNKALRDMRWWNDNLPELRKQADRMLAQNSVRASELPPGFGTGAGLNVSQSSSDNPLVYYLSGLLHQAAGNTDRAEIDYRNALAYVPDAEPILHALGTLEDKEPGLARLVIIHESDWVASKAPFGITVYIDRNLYTLSLPVYPENSSRWIAPDIPLRMENAILPPYPILNVNSVVHTSLEEEFSALLLRQALRMLAKHHLQEEARKSDPWLQVAASLYTALSDFPDLRSWLSLPASISLTDTSLPVGSYPFSAPTQEADSGRITLSSDQITLLHVVSAQGRVIKVDSMTIPTYDSIQ